MKPFSLLADFEILPEIREKALHCIGTRRRVALLLEQEPIIEDIITSLDEQRVRRDELGLLGDIRPVSDHARREMLGRTPATPMRNIQLAFTLPIDYRIPRGDIPPESSGDIIESLVIQPEYISDDFMIGLGFLSEQEKKGLDYGQKIQRKIEKLSAIKTLLKHARPIALGNGKESGRILLIQARGESYHGAYIVFQETTDIEKTEIGVKGRKKIQRKVTPRVYDSVFSLIRSQEYAVSGISARLRNLRDIRDHDLPRLAMKWKEDDYLDEAREEDLTALKEKLKGKSSYHERMALEERIAKIILRHPEQDFQRLRGACNDIIQAIESKIGKRSELRRQLDWLEDLEQGERGRYDIFYRTLMGHLESINKQRLLGLSLLDISEKSENLHLSGAEKSALGNIWFIIKTYIRGGDSRSRGSLGRPYEEMRATLEDHLAGFEASDTSSIDKRYLHSTLSLILSVKKYSYELLIKEIEHYKKRALGTPLPDEKIRILDKLEFVRRSLIAIPFLRNIPLTEHGQEKYAHMRDVLVAHKEGLAKK